MRWWNFAPAGSRRLPLAAPGISFAPQGSLAVTRSGISIGATICGLFALGCASPDMVDPSLNGALVQTCAPWDGPAVALFLTDQPAVATYPSAPYSSIVVYRSLSAALGKRFDIGPEAQNVGYAQSCPVGGECQPARGAWVSFGGFNADSTVQVEYRIDMTTARVMRGSVRARFHPTAALCG